MSRGFVDNENVVSMQFDNREFEKNVHQSLGTIDKLKKSLDFSGSVKGMEELDSCTKDLNVNTNALTSAIGAVSNKFSAMEIAGITAISRITDKVIDLGERLVKSLTVDQLASGWSKYEEKISAVQTIMAATANTWEENARRIGFAGTQMEYVNEQLNRLNWFSDETSYSFTDMTSNIGKFTSSGIALDQAVTAMEGISVWAAKSGQNAQSASRAYYNLAQAISVGAVKLIDWKSIENANMATIEFKQTAIDTAVALGTLKKVGDGVFETLDGHEVTVRNFNEALKDEWFTSEVLMESLEEYGKAAVRLSEISEDYGTQTTFFLRGLKDWQNGNRDITDISKSVGIEVEELIPLFEELSSSEYELSLSAFKAAQEAKTFSEVLSATKDAVSTKWMNTWELIFGDYEHAKELWSGVAEEFYDIFAAPGDARNELLEQTMGSAWDQIIDRINAAGIATGDFEKKLTENLRLAGIPIDALVKQYGSLSEAIKHVKNVGQHIRQTILSFTEPIAGSVEGIQNATQKLDEFQKVVNQVIRGNFKSGKERVDRLTKAGYDYATVQGLVNKVWEKNNHTWKDTTITMDDLIDVMGKMSNKELKSIGITEDEVEALQKLKLEVGTIGSDIDKLIKRVHKPSGKELIFSSIAHAISAIKKAIDVVRGAWRDVFPAKTSEELYGFLEAIEKITEWLDANDETLDKLRRTLRGIFSISGIFRDLIVAALRVFLPGLLKGTSEVGGGLLDITANIGDAIYGFREFLKSGELLTNILGYLRDMFLKSKEVLGELIKKGLELPVVGKILEGIADAVEKIKKFFKELWDIFYDAIIEDETTAFEALVRVFERLYDAFKGLEEKYPILTDIKDALSEFFSKFKEYGTNVLEGFLEGIGGKGLLEQIKTKITEFAETVYNTFADWMGIQSPAKKFIELALYCIAGFLVGIIEGTIYVVSAIRNFAKSIYDETSAIVDENPDSPVAKLRNYIRLALDGIKEYFAGLLDGVKKIISSIKEYIQDSGMFDNLVRITKTLLGLLYIISLIYLNFAAARSMSSIADAFSGIGDFFDSWAIKNYSAIARNLAIAVTALAVVVYLLARLTPEQFNQAITAIWAFIELAIVLGILMGALIAVNRLTAKFKPQKDSNKKSGGSGLFKIAALLISFAASVYLIVKAISDVKNIIDTEKGNDLAKSLIIVAGIIAALIGAVFAITKIAGYVPDAANNLIGAAITIGVISLCLNTILGDIYNYFINGESGKFIDLSSKENLSKFNKALGAVLIIIGFLAAAAAAISHFGGKGAVFGVSFTLIAMSFAISMVIDAISKMNEALSGIMDTTKAKNLEGNAAVGYLGMVLGTVVGIFLLLLGAVSGLILLLKKNAGASAGLIAAGIFLAFFVVAVYGIVASIKSMDDVLSSLKNPVKSIASVITIMAVIFAGTTLLSAYSQKSAVLTFIGVAAVIGAFAFAINSLLEDSKDIDKTAKLIDHFSNAIASILGIMGILNFLVEIVNGVLGGKAETWESALDKFGQLAGVALVIYNLGEALVKLSDIPWEQLEPMMEKLQSTLLLLIGLTYAANFAENLIKGIFHIESADYTMAASIGAMGVALKLIAEGITAILNALKDDPQWYNKLNTICGLVAILIVLLGAFIGVLGSVLKGSEGTLAVIALVIGALAFLILAISALLLAITYFVDHETLTKAFEKIVGWIEKIIDKIGDAIEKLGQFFLMMKNPGLIMAKSLSIDENGNIALSEDTKKKGFNILDFIRPGSSLRHNLNEKTNENKYDDVENKKKLKQWQKEHPDESFTVGEVKTYKMPTYLAGPKNAVETITEDSTVTSVGKTVGETAGKYIGNIFDQKLTDYYNHPLKGASDVSDYLGKVGLYGVESKTNIFKLPEGVANAKETVATLEEIWGSEIAQKLVSGEGIDVNTLITSFTGMGGMSGEAFTQEFMTKFSTGFDQKELEQMMQGWGLNSGTVFGQSWMFGFTEEQQKQYDTLNHIFDTINTVFGKAGVNINLGMPDIGATPNYDIFGMGGLGGFGNTVVQFPEKMETTSPDVVKAIETGTAQINTGINGLYTKIKGLYVRLDTGAMVGNLTPYISREIKGYVDQYAR